jgi:V/A-type H+-transporting ATPase subunit C
MAGNAALGTVRRAYRRVRESLPIESGNYPYVTARVKAKKSLLLAEDVYTRMLQMGVPAIARYLGEREYKAQILALGARYDGVDLVEMATRNRLAAVFTQILEFSEGHLRTMIAGYLGRWDVWNVKTILRGMSYGATQEEIFEDLVPAGSFSEAFLQELIALETIEEVLARLEGTIYHEAFQRLETDIEEMKGLAEYEDELAMLYYGNLQAAIPPTTEPNKLFRLFVQKEIDILNLKTLLRLWTEKVKPEREVFLPGGLELAVADLKALLDVDLQRLDARLGAYSFYSDIREGLRDVEGRGVGQLLRTLEKHHLKEASRYSHLHPLSILPVLDYVVSLEREVENLRIIARGKEAGLPTNVIRDLLVI